MDFNWSEWLNLALRWFHVVAGVFWIGQTALFSWLDLRLTVEADEEGGGKVWMVHSGGFYLVEKQSRVVDIPRTLHWFRWEATFTWLSGFLLLLVVYYMGGLLVEYDSEVSLALARTVGLGSLLAGWVVYDLLWLSPLGRREWLGGLVSFALLVATAWGFTQILSGRAAYIHTGAVLGTIMASNVWMRILPAQRRMIAAAREGRTPNMAEGERAKARSKHNTFLALPVIFIMISNHFPTASYGHRANWLMLGAFVVVGFGARKLLSLWEARR